MADEPTFAEQQVTGNTLSESDQIRKRITDYKAQITPNSLQVIEVMLQQQLSSGLLKPGDLDAMIILRDDVNKASIDYRTQLENAQRRLADLAQDEAIEKAQAEEAKIAAIVDARDVERQRRSLEYLENQLSSNKRTLGTKTALKYNLKHKSKKVKGDVVSLDDIDIKRKNKEDSRRTRYR